MRWQVRSGPMLSGVCAIIPSWAGRLYRNTHVLLVQRGDPFAFATIQRCSACTARSAEAERGVLRVECSEVLSAVILWCLLGVRASAERLPRLPSVCR